MPWHWNLNGKQMLVRTIIKQRPASTMCSYYFVSRQTFVADGCVFLCSLGNYMHIHAERSARAVPEVRGRIQPF